MRFQMLSALLIAGLAGSLGACQDAETPLDPGPPLFARGGNKGGGNPGPGEGIVPLGEILFADLTLSVNQNQSCATCHAPEEGFAAPTTAVTQGSVVQGSVPGKFGDRKPPTAAYATLSPIFNPAGNGAVGGNFWDGRATGDTLGNPAADQALGPFLNPKEQALPDEACLVYRVRSDYLDDWITAWGNEITLISFPSNTEAVCGTPVSESGQYVALSATDRARVHTAYQNAATSIMWYETTLNRFASRFDTGQLTPLEQEGEKLFSSKGKCHQCHLTNGSPVLFTDFEFHNLGVPKNPASPAYPYGSSAFDPGLGGYTNEGSDVGRFKTPTVRNAGLGSNRTFMHNGSLLTLRQVVQFYNTRDVLPQCTEDQLNHPEYWGPDGYGCWPAPEFGENMDTKFMGNLGLTDDEVNALVAFMRALTDP